MGFDRKRAQLSPARVESILNTLKEIKLDRKVTITFIDLSSYGSCIHGDTFGPSAHESISVMAKNQGISL